MPMMRRPVLRTVGRTAVIAGTASAVAGRVNRRQQNKWSQQDQQQAMQEQQMQQAPAAQPPAAPAADSDELINKLKELASLKEQGILTEAEFADQKAKILAQMS